MRLLSVTYENPGSEVDLPDGLYFGLSYETVFDKEKTMGYFIMIR